MRDTQKELQTLVERLTKCPASWKYRVALAEHTPAVGKELVIHIPDACDDTDHQFKSVGVVASVNAVCLAGGWHFFVSTVNGDLYIVQRSGFTHRSNQHNTFIGTVTGTVVLAPNTFFLSVSPLSAYSHLDNTLYTAHFANTTILNTVFIPNTNLVVFQVKQEKLDKVFHIICTSC